MASIRGYYKGKVILCQFTKINDLFDMRPTKVEAKIHRIRIKNNLAKQGKGAQHFCSPFVLKHTTSYIQYVCVAVHMSFCT